jgi:F-type H+-transporting ATPase subunit gamma
VITADRGLAGGYNSSVIRTAERRIRRHQAAGREVQLVITGRKGESYFRFRRQPIAASVTGVSEKPTYDDARRVVAAVMGPFQAAELDQIDLVYTRFISLGLQSVEDRQLVPMARRAEGIVPEADRRRLAATRATAEPPGAGLTAGSPSAGSPGAGSPGAGSTGAVGAVPGHKTDYEFEPEPAEILDRLLPRWLESEVLAAMLNAAASEQAARQRAMKAATDNADELIKTLRRIMNRARQDAITTEIMEIVGGAEALRQANVADGSEPPRETFVTAESA